MIINDLIGGLYSFYFKGDECLPMGKQLKHIKGAKKEKEKLGENRKNIEKRLAELYKKLAESELVAKKSSEK